MKAVRFILAGVLILALTHIQMSSAQQGGQGGWGGGSAGSWSSGNTQSGQHGSNGQSSYSYGGVDGNGVPYGGYGGNGGYRVNVTDEYGRQHTYSGGHGGYGGQSGQPGQYGQSGEPGYPGTFSYANTNRNHYGQPNSSASAYASAWSTFYVICLFSLFLIMKS